MQRFIPIFAAFAWSLSACGGASATAASPESVELAAPRGDVSTLAPGRYRLALSAPCSGQPPEVSGVLTLASIARSEVPKSAVASVATPRDGRPLLWGQTNVSVAAFEDCLGGTAANRGDPIHESVLVQVLEWEGQPKRQVLLVSTGSGTSAGGGATGGIALWVESARGGRISGAWSHWQLTGKRRGHWVAERLADDDPMASRSR